MEKVLKLRVAIAHLDPAKWCPCLQHITMYQNHQKYIKKLFRSNVNFDIFLDIIIYKVKSAIIPTAAHDHLRVDIFPVNFFFFFIYFNRYFIFPLTLMTLYHVFVFLIENSKKTVVILIKNTKLMKLKKYQFLYLKQ